MDIIMNILEQKWALTGGLRIVNSMINKLNFTITFLHTNDKTIIDITIIDITIVDITLT